MTTMSVQSNESAHPARDIERDHPELVRLLGELNNNICYVAITDGVRVAPKDCRMLDLTYDDMILGLFHTFPPDKRLCHLYGHLCGACECVEFSADQNYDFSGSCQVMAHAQKAFIVARLQEIFPMFSLLENQKFAVAMCIDDILQYIATHTMSPPNEVNHK